MKLERPFLAGVLAMTSWAWNTAADAGPLAVTEAKIQNGKLIICGLTGAVEEVFTTTKMVSSSGSMNAPFEMAPDREAAVARLAGVETRTA